MKLSIGMVAPVVQMFLFIILFSAVERRAHAVLSISELSADLQCAELQRLCVFRLSGFLLGYVQCLLRRVRLHLYLQWDQEAMLHHTNTATITNLTKC